MCACRCFVGVGSFVAAAAAASSVRLCLLVGNALVLHLDFESCPPGCFGADWFEIWGCSHFARIVRVILRLKQLPLKPRSSLVLGLKLQTVAKLAV